MDTIQLTEANRLFVFTEEELVKAIDRVLNRRAAEQTAPVVENKDSEMPTRLAKKYLKGKGYHTTSHEGFAWVVKEYGLQATRKGRENWYKVSDLEKIPKRI